MSLVLATGDDGSGSYGLDCIAVVDWIPKNTALQI